MSNECLEHGEELLQERANKGQKSAPTYIDVDDEDESLIDARKVTRASSGMLPHLSNSH